MIYRKQKLIYFLLFFVSARLDGTNKRIKHTTIEDYLQMDGWEPPPMSTNGKKRVSIHWNSWFPSSLFIIFYLFCFFKSSNGRFVGPTLRRNVNMINSVRLDLWLGKPIGRTWSISPEITLVHLNESNISKKWRRIDIHFGVYPLNRIANTYCNAQCIVSLDLRLSNASVFAFSITLKMFKSIEL